MYYVYVIYSPGHRKYYKGHSTDLEKRLDGHNSGNTKSTRKYRPWVLVYSEPYNTLEETLVRERYLKTAAGRRFLKYKVNMEE